MKELSKAKQEAFVLDEMKAWVREDVEPTLKIAIAKRQKHIPSETANNLKHEIRSGLSDALAQYELSFQDSGRHVDMRNLEFDKAPILPGNHFIFDWAKRKGASKFRNGVPGYDNRSGRRLSEQDRLLRIANAIVMAKKMNKKKHKRRGAWYNKTIYQLISKLTSRLAINQALWIQGAMREEIEAAFKTGTVDLGAFKFKVKR